jgi:pyruvate dehydrogenase E2 component (dihydrolipoamide acetyltransferase)
VAATPIARRLAERSGIDLEAVTGTGSGGRIVKADVEAASEKAAAPLPAAGSREGASTLVPLSRMRRTIASRLAEAKRTIPHFYLSADCEIDRLLETRARLNDEERRISVNDFVVRAAALALVEVPEANVSFSDEGIVRYEQVDVAVAVATEGGLIAPVVRGADRKELVELSREIRDLAARAREGTLAPREYQGGTFTVSNLGMYGVGSVYPILNPPQSCILGVGAGTKKPVVRDGELAVGTVMTLTLSADHRAVDGALGARLLAAVKRRLEDPLEMLL